MVWRTRGSALQVDIRYGEPPFCCGKGEIEAVPQLPGGVAGFDFSAAVRVSACAPLPQLPQSGGHYAPHCVLARPPAPCQRRAHAVPASFMLGSEVDAEKTVVFVGLYCAPF